MKSVVLHEDKTLKIQDSPMPNLSGGQVLVHLKASALNHRELWIAQGLYPGMKLPCILGADGAGVVEAVAADMEPECIGQEVIIYPAYDWGSSESAPTRDFRVLGMPDPGTMAEYIAVDLDMLVPKPSYMSWTQAASLPVAYLTAWRALMTHGQMSTSMRILITGIGGGVARAGLSLARAAGAEVWVTSSSQDKIENAISLGAAGGVNYKDDSWPQDLVAQSGRIDLVLDSSPLAELDRYLKFLNYGGKIVAYGSTANRLTTLNISKFFLRQIQFIGTAMGSPREFRQLIDFLELHEIDIPIDRVFPLNQAVEAMQYLATGQQEGKVVLDHREIS